MERRGYMLTGGVIAAGALILATGHESGPKTGEQPKEPSTVEYVCDADPSHTVTMEKGDTVSGRVARPLAGELGVGPNEALKLVEKANPRINLSHVAVKQVINVPINCHKE